MTDIRERFWTWWLDGIPQPVSDRLFKRAVNSAFQDVAEQLSEEVKRLRAENADLRSRPCGTCGLPPIGD